MLIHRMTHLGFVTADTEAAVARLIALFGLKRPMVRPTWLAAEEGVLSTILYGTGGGVEPMQPITAGTPFAEALRLGRSAYHLSFRVTDIRAVAEMLWRCGLWVQLRPPGDVVQMHRLWIDPRSACGAHIEFIDRAERETFLPTRTADSVVPVVQGTHITKICSAIHIVDRLDDARRFYGDVLGFTSADVQTSPDDGIEQVRFCVGDGRFGDGEAGPYVDVVTVRDPDSPFGEIKASIGCGIGAWTFEVADIGATHERLARLECWLRILKETKVSSRRILIHPRSTGGVPIMLVPADN